METSAIKSSKASSLKVLSDNGLPVPDFFVLPVDEIELILKPKKGELEELKEKLKIAEQQQLGPTSEQIRELIRNARVPEDLMNEIRSRCENLFGRDYRISVRSSALKEDRPDASFAGQMDTFLDVRESQLEEKILACIASGYNESAIQYRQMNGFDPTDGQMEVIIQKMVEADYAGVIFSVNPNGSLNDTSLVVGKGSGEGVVSGKTITDHYFIDRTSKVVRINSGGAELDLTREKVMSLFELGQRSEELFESPQDLEFTVGVDGKVWVLQSRPITNLPKENIKILDNSNIIESYPGITLPLSFSFAKNGYEQVFRGCARPFGISQKDLDENKDALANLLTHLNGRVYYRLDNWYRIMSLVLASEKRLREWENNLGIRRSETNKIKINYSKKLRSIIILIRLVLNYRKMNRQFYKDFEVNYSALKGSLSKDWPLGKLFSFYREKAHVLFRAWSPTQVNDFITFRAFSALQGRLSKLGFAEEENLANDLMCGMSGVESELPMLKLLEMKADILADNTLCQIFKTQKPELVYDEIQRPEFRAFYSKFAEYIDLYGDRTLEELKLETPSLRQQPALLIKRLKQHLETDHTTASFASRQESIRDGAENRLRKQLSWYNPNSWIVNFLKKTTRYGLRNRENMRLARTRSYGVVKEIFEVVAKDMVENKVIDRPSDVFYLDHADLERYCLAEDKVDLREKITSRKADFEKYREIKMPNRVIYSGEDEPVFEGDGMEYSQAEGRYKAIPVSRGEVEGEVLVLEHPDAEVDVRGKILVTKMTDPGWLFLMSQAKGLISESGSLLSHTAIVGRELGLPTVVGLPHATSVFKSGQRIRLNGASGLIQVLEKSQGEV